MKSIKYIICCCAALALLVAGCATTEHVDSSNSMAETKNVSAQEYLANSIKIEAGQPAKGQIQDLYELNVKKDKSI